MSLQGVLSDFGVAEVFQLIAQQRKSGVLEIECGDRQLQVIFSGGMVVRARPGESKPDAALADFLIRTGVVSEPALAEARRTQKETLEPLPRILLDAEALREEDLEKVRRLISHETIFELFQWEDGRFNFHNEEIGDEPGDEALAAEQVLLEAIRMKDEWHRIELELPDLWAVLAPTEDIEGFRVQRATVAGDAGMDPEDLEGLFRLANGRAPARRVIDLSLLGTFAGAKGLIALRSAGLLRIVDAPRPEPAEPAEPAAGKRRLTQSAGVLGLAATLAAALWTVPPAEVSSYPVPADALREARAAAAADRVRLELEASRWNEGKYPQTLYELAEGPSLAPISADRYIYAPLDRGYALYPLLP